MFNMFCLWVLPFKVCVLKHSLAFSLRNPVLTFLNHVKMTKEAICDRVCNIVFGYSLFIHKPQAETYRISNVFHFFLL